MRRLRIAIDQRLAAAHSPEIHWTWRLLLTAIGWTWEEVTLDSACDIAYVSEPAEAPKANLCIQADPAAWARPAAYRLGGVGCHDGLVHPLFEGKAVVPDPVQARSSQLRCHRDLVFDVFWLVTGQEEQHWPRDRHGFLDLTGTAVGTQDRVTFSGARR